MGVKAMIMENEEKFWDRAEELIGGCESFQEFEGIMYEKHYDLMEHRYWDDMHDNLQEYWGDFWGKYL